ncbi:MAG: YjbH domain-containing protein [Candidatus Syntrophosphaera sp.]|nr:YjbH domain-containing protein [Candidatus Syntrophosphaera sp.]
MKRLVLSVIVLAATFGLMEAAPFQTLGLLRTPDAYVLPHKAAELVLVGYYRNVEAPSYVGDEYNGFIPYGMIGVGILDRVELGFFGGDDVYFMNAKLKVIQESGTLPQISVGMDNIFSPVNKHRAQDYNPDDYPDIEWADHPDKVDYEYYSPYVVASKQAVFGGLSWMFNLGWGQNRYTGQVARSRIFNGLFSSIEISPFKDFAIQGEYDGKDFNAGLKYTVKNFTFRLGGEALEDLAKGSEGNGYEKNLRLAFGVSYLFDKYAEAKRRPELRRYAQDTDMDGTKIVTGGEIPVGVTESGTSVSILTPGTSLQSPGIVESSSYKELSPEVKDLLAELRNLREERQKAQKALEDLRKWLQELQEQNN